MTSNSEKKTNSIKHGSLKTKSRSKTIEIRSNIIGVTINVHRLNSSKTPIRSKAQIQIVRPWSEIFLMFDGSLQEDLGI